MKTEICRMEIRKNPDGIFFYLKLPEELEAQFKDWAKEENQGEYKQASQRWVGYSRRALYFYLNSEKFEKWIKAGTTNNNYTNNYGDSMLSWYPMGMFYPNVSILRTLGAGKGVLIACPQGIAYEEAKKFMELTALLIKRAMEYVPETYHVLIEV